MVETTSADGLWRERKPEEQKDSPFLWLEDPQGWWRAVVNDNGCVDFYRFHNEPLYEDDADYIHICNVDDFIERLQSLKEVAKQHYGETWK
jgi:hypothetical protein